MEFFFNPKGIALIGATPHPAKGGFSILTNLSKGFSGNIYPINPKYPSISGRTCYPSVMDVPDPVDLAIVFVPAALVPNAVRECVKRNIPGVMIESGGFSETGPAGKMLQDELQRISQETGIRIWGPNCMGLVDAVHRHVFSFAATTIWDFGLVPGDVSLIVQSGMLSAGFLIDTISHGTMGISKVCSIGNKVDVEECELLDYLIRDDNTQTIGLYMESIPDGRRFLEIGSRSTKPIVVLKGGKSQKGAQAALSHTASLAGNGAVVTGALSQAGIIEASDFKQMIDMCRTLSAFPNISPALPGRVAVLTYSGGAGIVSADFIENAGLVVADLSAATREALCDVFPDWMPISNPIDLWPAVEKNGGETTYRAAIEAVCADPNVDAVFLHLFAGGFSLNFDLKPVADTVRSSGKPLIVWLIGEREISFDLQKTIQQQGFPVFREIHRAIECLQAVFTRSKRELPWSPVPDAQIADADFSIRQEQLSTHPAGFLLDEHVSKKVLADFGIPTVAEKIVHTQSEAKACGAIFGFPLVMKGMAPQIVHKTEMGLVRIGIQSDEQIETTFSELHQTMPAGGSILMQPQVRGDIEMIAGFLRDPQFGPCVMLGLGGIFAEALKDTAFAVAPLAPSDAFHLIDRLRSQQILNGFRNSPPVDRDALADILIRLGRIGMIFPQIQAIDINPLIVSKGMPIAVDASIEIH